MIAERTQTAVPYLYYNDCAAALDYLVEVFGFEERKRQARPDGSIDHAEVLFGHDVIMLATNPAGPSQGTGSEHDSLYCYVDDAKAHCAQLREAGATIVFAPMDRGFGMFYGVKDSEGRTWYFAERED